MGEMVEAVFSLLQKCNGLFENEVGREGEIDRRQPWGGSEVG